MSTVKFGHAISHQCDDSACISEMIAPTFQKVVKVVKQQRVDTYRIVPTALTAFNNSAVKVDGSMEEVVVTTAAGRRSAFSLAKAAREARDSAAERRSAFSFATEARDMRNCSISLLRIARSEAAVGGGEEVNGLSVVCAEPVKCA